jgi:hypothetical protein
MKRGFAVVPATLVKWTGRLSSALQKFWYGVLSDRSDGYWPERYYMRGPGPQWHEKHARIRARTK